MPWSDTAFFIVGLIILTVGADLLVRGAAGLAAVVGISPLVIGLTIVAMGTSAPEFVVSIQSSYMGEDEVAVANVVGSNIFNVAFILGMCALAKPLIVSSRLILMDVPFMIACTFVFWFMAYPGDINRVNGVILLMLLIGYLVWTVRMSRRESREIQEEFAQEFGVVPKNRSTLATVLIDVALTVVGVGFLVFGGRLFVDGAIGIARFAGISEAVIGLTIIAAGTSIPEAATSLVATLRGERDIAIGNVVGSNISNLLLIMGLASVVSPGGLQVAPSLLRLDIPVMAFFAVICWPIFYSGRQISRLEGGALFAGYIAYIIYLIWGTDAMKAVAGT